MSIIISNAPVRPELEFNKVHLDSLNIVQGKRSNDSEHPVYIVQIEYRLYGIDSNNKIEYEPKLRRIVIEDYLQEGLQKLQEDNDPTMLQALAAIEQALASIIATNSEYGDTQVF